MSLLTVGIARFAAGRGAATLELRLLRSIAEDSDAATDLAGDVRRRECA